MYKTWNNTIIYQVLMNTTESTDRFVHINNQHYNERTRKWDCGQRKKRHSILVANDRKHYQNTNNNNPSGYLLYLQYLICIQQLWTKLLWPNSPAPIRLALHIQLDPIEWVERASKQASEKANEWANVSETNPIRKCTLWPNKNVNANRKYF